MSKWNKRDRSATRSYALQLNEKQSKALSIFKKLRPDLKTNKQISQYAYKLFWNNYNDMFLTVYKWLKDDTAHYTKMLIFKLSYKEHCEIKINIERINTRFKDNLSKPEYFRKIFLFMLYEYGLFNPEDKEPFVLYEPDDLELFVENLDDNYQQEIISAWEEHGDIDSDDNMETDDVTIVVENTDDTTLEIENEEVVEDVEDIVEDIVEDDISLRLEYLNEFFFDEDYS